MSLEPDDKHAKDTGDPPPMLPQLATVPQWVPPPVLVATEDFAPMVRFTGVLWLGFGGACILLAQECRKELVPWVSYVFYGLAPALILTGLQLFTARRKALPAAAAALALVCVHLALFQIQVHAEHAGQRLHESIGPAAAGVVIGPLIVWGMISAYRRAGNWRERKPKPSKPPAPPREEEIEANPGWDEGDRR